MPVQKPLSLIKILYLPAVYFLDPPPVMSPRLLIETYLDNVCKQRIFPKKIDDGDTPSGPDRCKFLNV